MFGGSLAPKGAVSLYNQVTGPSSYPTYTYTSLGQAFMNAYLLNNSSYERVLDIVSLGMPNGSSGGSCIRFLTNPKTSGAAAVERLRINFDGTIVASSTMTSTGFYQSSLRALKKNIKPFTKSALEILNGVDVMTYRYRNDDGNQHVGIIADDSHELLAGKNHDHFDQGNTTGLLIKAVQELTAKCDRLETELKTLRSC